MDDTWKEQKRGKKKISSGLPIALEHCPKIIQDLVRNGVANNQREKKKKRSGEIIWTYIYIYTQIARIIAQGNELWDINIGSITIVSKTL